MGDAMTLGHARLARLDEFEIGGRRGDISFAEFVMNDDASLGQVAEVTQDGQELQEVRS